MSTSSIAAIPNAETPGPGRDASASAGQLLICTPWLAAEDLRLMQERISSAFPMQAVHLATHEPAGSPGSYITPVEYPADAAARSGLVLTAADYLTAAELTRQHSASAALLLGAEAVSLSPETLRLLAAPVLAGHADLVLPRYTTGPHEALVSSALLYPLTYALFGAETHLPLPLDAAFSPRMAARFSVVARKPNSAEPEPLLWPVAEAATASFLIREIEAGDRTLPDPGDLDLNSLLARVAGSLFADIEAKAAFWQRARPIPAPKPGPRPTPPVVAPEDDDLHSMTDSFRNAFLNLQEVWSLVLPPQSLLAIKKVSQSPPDAFQMPPSLWARTVYDFVLAWHLRTINRGHLLGAFTPLYLAWVASHLRRSAGDAALAAWHVEATADAFIAEKPYIVSRWRWPDRFNP